jgi:hypothetical protein
MMLRPTVALVVACASVVVAAGAGPAAAGTTKIVYDSFSPPYSLADYNAKWSNPYGLGDMAVSPGDTRSFMDGAFTIEDAPFRTQNDFSVFDHLKYIAVSNQSFPVPANGGTVTFSSQITATTPGTDVGRVVHGTYGPPGSYPSGSPYTATLFEGQQAGAVMNVINFATGQLFDWFISGSRAFTLVERLPSTVTGNTSDPGSPDYVGPGKMYTQIVSEIPISSGRHTVAIRYGRKAGKLGTATVQFLLDGEGVSTVDHVGIPLDSRLRTKPVRWTGVYPSATYPGGPPATGEELGGKISSFVIGHGTFSLVDAFPFQWGWGFDTFGNLACLAPGPWCDLGSVSLPPSERLFGQGVDATFDSFVVTTNGK